MKVEPRAAPVEGSQIAPGAERFQPTPLDDRQWRLLRSFAVFVVISTFLYLGWRVTSTISGADLWLAVPFLLLELHGAIRFSMTVAELWNTDAAPPLRSRTWPGLSVAVVIPTYDEGPEVLLPTVAAAIELRGEHETWVLDDGHRPEVERMAEQLGCGYISRPTNEHAKAGNMNFALGVIDTDLIAVLDADHVAQPEFLEAVVPYFHDERVALVQTPQEFYNVDSFVHTEPGHHEELFFHRVIQAGKNHYDAAFWCGTGSMIRAEALREIGGASTVSITEDLHTAMLLQRAGWKTVHHNRPVARGLAPRNYEEFSKQRWRWGAGAMQSFAVDFPLTTPGLTRGQRFAYFASFVSWFDSWRTFFYFLVPLVVLTTGASPISAPLVPLLPAALLIVAGQLLTIRLMARGSLRLWFAAVNEFLRLPVNLSSTMVFVRPRALGFSVTPKGRTEGQRTSYAAPRLLKVLGSLGLLAGAFGAASVAGVTALSYERVSVAWIALAWLTANLVVLLAAVRRISDVRFGSEQRGATRLHVPAVAEVAGRPAQLDDLSMGGARLTVQGDWSNTVNAVARVRIGFARVVELDARIIRLYDAGVTSTVGVEFLGEQWAPLAVLALEMHRSGPALRSVAGPERVATAETDAAPLERVA